VETVYPGLAYFHEAGRGGHFAAWEEPELFSREVQSAHCAKEAPVSGVRQEVQCHEDCRMSQ
jgi:hypothetical protein